MVNLIARASSHDPRPFLTYAAIGPGCWGTHDALSTYLLTSSLSLSMDLCTVVTSCVFLSPSPFLSFSVSARPDSSTWDLWVPFEESSF